MIGFLINLAIFMLNLSLGLAFGFSVWTGIALGVSAMAAIACLLIDLAS